MTLTNTVMCIRGNGLDGEKRRYVDDDAQRGDIATDDGAEDVVKEDHGDEVQLEVLSYGGAVDDVHRPDAHVAERARVVHQQRHVETAVAPDQPPNRRLELVPILAE